MDGMNAPFEQKIVGDKIIRTFSSEVESEELKWHRDLRDRNVKIISGEGWFFQSEDSLPIELKKNQELFIPKNSWHRVIKGKGELIVEITES